MADDARWLDQIEAVVAPVLASRGMSLVDSEWQREGRRWVLRLFVDKPGGVGIADSVFREMMKMQGAANVGA